jgi:hypothetical protein
LITIRCAKCRAKLFKYVKVGKGQVRHLWPDRIVEDSSIREGKEVRCTCGNVVGREDKMFIKMRQSAFTSTGRKTGK